MWKRSPCAHRTFWAGIAPVAALSCFHRLDVRFKVGESLQSPIVQQPALRRKCPDAGLKVSNRRNVVYKYVDKRKLLGWAKCSTGALYRSVGRYRRGILLCLALKKFCRPAHLPARLQPSACVSCLTFLRANPRGESKGCSSSLIDAFYVVLSMSLLVYRDFMFFLLARPSMCTAVDDAQPRRK